MLKSISLIIICICSYTLEIQAQTIHGNVVNEEQQPMPFANIVFMKADSTYVNSTIADDMGGFFIPYNKEIKLLNVSYIGYVPQYQTIETASIGTIQMLPDAAMLGEVVVTGSRPVIKRDVDRLVFNVESTPLSQGSNALELLKQTPLVKATDTSIGIIGKSDVKIMLNGKISYLSGNDLMQYLKTLQSDDVASIEVITTPPSRYDAGGNGGMINIVTKRNPEEGLNGNVGAAYTQRTFAGENVNATVNYRSARSFLSLKLRQSHNKGFVDENYTISQPSKMQTSSTGRTDTYNTYGANIALEQQLSSSSILGVIYDFSY
ncbi:MAG: carboxypeptidase-like regulatory domain-containing protein, partial [Muribaculaceae bacterium]|nr:carboxypeptidase-like regulatory domain-containing protein [Muribaculaceae bacterium]